MTSGTNISPDCTEYFLKFKELLKLVASRQLKHCAIFFTNKKLSISKILALYEYFKASQRFKMNEKLVIICTEPEMEEDGGDTLIFKEWKNQEKFGDYGDVFKISDIENKNLKRIKFYLLAVELSRSLEDDGFKTKFLQYSREFLLSNVFEY